MNTRSYGYTTNTDKSSDPASFVDFRDALEEDLTMPGDIDVFKTFDDCTDFIKMSAEEITRAGKSHRIQKFKNEAREFAKLPKVSIISIKSEFLPVRFFTDSNRIVIDRPEISMSKNESSKSSLKGTLFDTRLGSSPEADCDTCNQPSCEGHQGVIEFPKQTPVINPSFASDIVKILNTICLHCEPPRFILNHSEIDSLIRPTQTRAQRIQVISDNSNGKCRNEQCGRTFTLKSKQIQATGRIIFDEKSVRGVPAKEKEYEGYFAYHKFRSLDQKMLDYLKFDSLDEICSMFCCGIIVSPPKQRQTNEVDGRYMASDETRVLSEIITQSNTLKRLIESEDLPKNTEKPQDLDSLEKVRNDLQERLIEIEDVFERTQDDNLRIEMSEIRKQIVQVENSITDLGKLQAKSKNRNRDKAINKEKTSKREALSELYAKCKVFMKIIDKTFLGKRSTVRKGASGKEGGQSGRAVASVGVGLELCEVGIPEYLTDKLTREEPVTVMNQNRMRDLMRTGKILYIIDIYGRTRNVNRAYINADGPPPQPGERVIRRLQDGDLVLIVRMPTLHRGNMQAFFAKIIPNVMVAGTHLGITTAYNLDYDGDELSIYIPQSDKTIKEVLLNAYAGRSLISHKSGYPITGFVYNAPLSWHKATLGTVEIPYDMWRTAIEKLTNREQLGSFMKRLRMFGLTRMTAEGREVPVMNGRTYFSLLLPEDFDYPVSSDKPYKGILIKSGILLEGTLTADHLGPNKGNTIVHDINFNYGFKFASGFITDGYELSYLFLERFPHTVGMIDCDYARTVVPYYLTGPKIGTVVDEDEIEGKHLFTKEEYDRYLAKKKFIDEFDEDNSTAREILRRNQYQEQVDKIDPDKIILVRYDKIINKEHSNMLDKATLEIYKLGPRPRDPRKALWYDAQLDNILAGLSGVGSQAFSKSAKLRENNLAKMVNAGSKGSVDTAGRIGFGVGKQTQYGTYIRPGIQNNTRCFISQRSQDASFLSVGYNTNSYIQGKTPEELPVETINDRDSTMATPIKAPEIGNLSRNMGRSMDEIVVMDGACRTVSGQVFQFSYGGDGFKTDKLRKMGDVYSFIDIKREVQRINQKYGWVTNHKAIVDVDNYHAKLLYSKYDLDDYVDVEEIEARKRSQYLIDAFNDVNMIY